MRNRKADEQLGMLGYGLILLFIIGLCAGAMGWVVVKEKQPIINSVKWRMDMIALNSTAPNFLDRFHSVWGRLRRQGIESLAWVAIGDVTIVCTEEQRNKFVNERNKRMDRTIKFRA